MNRATLLAQLEQAQSHIALGQRHIDRQIEIVSDLERKGYPTGQAYLLLATFRQSQEEHEAHRARILHNLKHQNAAEAPNP
jgi:hypothetical protein